MEKTIEGFQKFLNFSTFLLNLATLCPEELALLYTEQELSGFAAAARRRDERFYKALVSCFPGGEQELLAAREEDYSPGEQVLAAECAKYNGLAAHIVDAIMVVRRVNYAACAQMMAL